MFFLKPQMIRIWSTLLFIFGVGSILIIFITGVQIIHDVYLQQSCKDDPFAEFEIVSSKPIKHINDLKGPYCVSVNGKKIILAEKFRWGTKNYAIAPWRVFFKSLLALIPFLFTLIFGFWIKWVLTGNKPNS